MPPASATLTAADFARFRAQAEATPEALRPTSSLIYFSSVTDNTARFVAKLGLDAARIPVRNNEPMTVATEPYVLLVPTYGAGSDRVDAVPKQVQRFLDIETNRRLLRGVIGSGNTNFGEHFCEAADIISAKLGVPTLYRFELMGTTEDVVAVTQGLDSFWTRLSQT